MRVSNSETIARAHEQVAEVAATPGVARWQLLPDARRRNVDRGLLL
jgi:hypothetical protein